MLTALASAFAADHNQPLILIASAFILPLSLYDTLRTLCLLHGSASTSALGSAFWILIEVPLMLRIPVTAEGFLMAWAAGVIAAIVFQISGIGWKQLSPAVPDQSFWRMGLQYGLERLVSSGATKTLMLIAIVLVPVEVVGALRGLMGILGPLNVAYAVIPVALIGWQQSRSEGISLLRSAKVSAFASLLPISVGFVLIVGGPYVGPILLGASWPLAVPFVVAAMTQKLFFALSLGPYAVLRSRGSTASLFPKLCEGLVTLTFGIALGRGWGGHGIVWGMAAGAIIGFILLARAARTSTRPPAGKPAI